MNTQNQKQFIKMLDSDKLTTIPPINIELELDVLATVALKPEFNFKINELTEDCFYNENKKIYQVFKKMFNEENIIDIATLSSKVNCLNLFNRNYTVLSYQLDSQIKELKELAGKRMLQSMAYKTVLMIKENQSLSTIKNYLQDQSVKVNSPDSEITDKVIGDAFDCYTAGERISLKTGFEKFDNATGGLLNGTYSVVAAAQGIGKSTYLINIITNICKNNKKILLVSLEMNFLAIYIKILSCLSGILTSKIMFHPGELKVEEWQKINDARNKILNFKISRLGEKEVSVSDIRSRLKKEQDIDIVMIDYLQLLKPDVKSTNMYEIISDISRSLKVLASEFNIPFLVVSSINRNWSSRVDFIPRISDLRGSGTIEFDSDMVILLYRKSAFKTYDSLKDNNEFISDEYSYKHSLECTIAKNRFGESNLKIYMFFDGEISLVKEVFNSDDAGYEQQQIK